MANFLVFSSTLLSQVCDFLMTDPIQWFVGIFLLVAIARVVLSITRVN